MNDDLSDEAGEEWAQANPAYGAHAVVVKKVWSEVKRRALAMLEAEKKRFEEVSKIAHEKNAESFRKGLQVIRLEEQIAERERKAFEAGWTAALNQHGGLLVSHGVTDWSIQFDEKWRAYQAEQKEGRENER
jgi:hypothetical protein